MKNKKIKIKVEIAELDQILLNYKCLFSFYEQFKEGPADETRDESESGESEFESGPEGRNLKGKISLTQANFKLECENQLLRNKISKLAKKHQSMESTQNGILKKMKNLRKIQMDSELSKRWAGELGDLDTIIEDSEIFLGTVVDTQKSMKKIFFGDSGISTQKQPKMIDSKELEKYQVAIDKLSRKLETVNFSNFDTSDLQELDNQINDSDNPVDVALLLIDSFERRVLDLKSNIDLLQMENGRFCF